jgi:diphthine synthase
MVSGIIESLCDLKSWLAIAGAGISSETMTVGLLKLADCADMIYVETYTTPRFEWIAGELKKLKKHVQLADRNLVETQSRQLVEQALMKRVLLVAPGDPLIATTHKSLIAEARKSNVECVILPGVSGVCAAKALSGLDYYNFGRTLTIPGPWRGARPYSVVRGIAGNLCIGLHTLLLLDINPASGDQLDPCLGLSRIRDVLLDENLPDIIGPAEMIIVQRAGLPDSKIARVGGIEELCKFGDTREPVSVVIPGRVPRYEREVALESFGIEINGNHKLSSDACTIYSATADW